MSGDEAEEFEMGLGVGQTISDSLPNKSGGVMNDPWMAAADGEAQELEGARTTHARGSA